MAINVSMTGSGTIGDIVPGWSIREEATPVVIGTTAGGYGAVDLAAKANLDSAFVINNEVTTTVDSGFISGIIKNVSISGQTASVSHDTVLAKYDGERYLPTVVEGSAHSALDMVNQIIGIDTRLKHPYGNFWSLAGHLSGFNSSGVLADFKEYYDLVSWWDSQGTSITEQRVIINRDTPYCLQFSYLGQSIFADYVYGDSLSIDPNAPINRVAWKTLIPSAGSNEIALEGLPDSSNIGSGFNITVGVSRLTDTAYIGGDYRYGGILTDITESVSLAGLDLDEELAIFFTFNNKSMYSGDLSGDLIFFSPSYDITIKVCNTSDYTNVKTLTWTMYSSEVSYIGRWKISGYVRALWTRNDNAAELISEWENLPSYVIDSSVIAQGLPTHGATGGSVNVWEYLQEACSAYGQEIAIIDDVVTVRQVGLNEIDITEHSDFITLSPTSTLTGTSIDIVYINSQGTAASQDPYSRETIYSAYADKNRILSVNVGETITTTIETDSVILSVLNPRQTGSITSINTGTSFYTVSGSDGIPITVGSWELFGGSLTVSVNPYNIKAIDVTIVGPSTVIPGAAGPYSIAYSSGTQSYAGMLVSGTALKLTPKTLSLQTGADPTKTAGASVTTISNRFISDIDQAYDRGIWASIEASGPRVTISGTIPVSAINGLGLVAGSRIRYQDSIYRITNSTIGNLSVSFDAARYVTVQDFDQVWYGRILSLHDAMWSGFQVGDQMVAPLRFIGDDETIVLALDTDINPYYDFSGEPEISVLSDEDTSPYYVADPSAEGAEPVYLDTDTNPYVEN